MVARQLLWGPYLQNRWVDFVHFLHADWYGVAGFTKKNSASSNQYLGHERISLFPWQPIGIFKFFLREVTFGLLQIVCVRFGEDRSEIQGVDPEQTNGRQTQIIVRFGYPQAILDVCDRTTWKINDGQLSPKTSVV